MDTIIFLIVCGVVISGISLFVVAYRRRSFAPARPDDFVSIPNGSGRGTDSNSVEVVLNVPVESGVVVGKKQKPPFKVKFAKGERVCSLISEFRLTSGGECMAVVELDSPSGLKRKIIRPMDLLRVNY